MGYVKLIGSKYHNNWVSSIKLNDNLIIEKDTPIDLNNELRKKLEARGYIFAESSADEITKIQEEKENQPIVGQDVVGTAPVFGNIKQKTRRR